MSNRFEGSGNLGKAPALRNVPTANGDRNVCDLWVYFDRPKRQEDGSFEEDGGFFMGVSIWGPRAENAMKLFTKGMRVYVEGNMRLETWEDSSEGTKSEMRISATKVLIDPICLESVIRRKNSKPTQEAMAEELEEQAA